MTKIRIRCRVPEKERVGALVSGRLADVSGRLADISDTEITAIGDDGTEVALTNVEEITFRVGCDPEPARVFVTFLQPEIDVEGIDEREDLVARAAQLKAFVSRRNREQMRETARLARVLHWLEERDGAGHAEFIQRYVEGDAQPSGLDDWNALSPAEQARWCGEAYKLLGWMRERPSAAEPETPRTPGRVDFGAMKLEVDGGAVDASLDEHETP